MSEEDVPSIVERSNVLHLPQRKPGKTRGRKARAADAAAGGGGPDDLDDGGFSIEDMNEEWALVLLGSKAAIVREIAEPEAPIEDRLKFLSVDAFKMLLYNSHTERRGADGRVKTISHAEAFLRSRRRRTFHGVEFFPDRDMVPGTPGYLNLWRGFSVVAEKRRGGTYTIFLDHMKTNICQGNQEIFDWLWAWFANMLQRPRERKGTAVVLRGGQGTGKTKLGEVMGSLIQSHYFLIDDPRYMVGQFNAHMASCLLLQADESFWAGDKAREGRLKGLITADFQMIEHKGVDPIRLKNYVRLLITSNEEWVIPAGKDERRYLVLDMGDAAAQQHDYFAELDAELASGGREALLHDLLEHDCSKINLRQAPRTDALWHQKMHSLDNTAAWWFERLDAAEITRSAEGWSRTIAVDVLFDDYAKFVDRRAIGKLELRPIWAKRLREMLAGDLKSARPRGPEGRINQYDVPSLAEARSAFESYVRQRVVWSDTDLPVSERVRRDDFAF